MLSCEGQGTINLWSPLFVFVRILSLSSNKNHSFHMCLFIKFLNSHNYIKVFFNQKSNFEHWLPKKMWCSRSYKIGNDRVTDLSVDSGDLFICLQLQGLLVPSQWHERSDRSLLNIHIFGARWDLAQAKKVVIHNYEFKKPCVWIV